MILKQIMAIENWLMRLIGRKQPPKAAGVAFGFFPFRLLYAGFPSISLLVSCFFSSFFFPQFNLCMFDTVASCQFQLLAVASASYSNENKQ